MQKFIVDKKDDYSAHYQYCAQHHLPFVRVIHALKYSKVEFDVSEMVMLKALSREQPSDFIIDLYRHYARFTRLPNDKFSCAGGSNNLIFSVYREHAEPFAAQLYDYLLKFVISQQR
ncbi:hypothetical protein LGH70_22820 [Hymenobacter sp. BT635]|uniref:Uncharacterized protein n=1 Tax=Hymenobacter nitidus TaxID=2880929 RepID=A0ABS8AK68_9BACT|nr:hypothetical protein [Hymenobacter nitidus]MCB2380444.1 hypothetical protein [Hymenobacter nitidus]